MKIYYKSIEDLEVSSGSSVFAKGMIKADKFDIEVSSGSSGTITLSTDFLDVEISSGSSFRAPDFVIQSADVEVRSRSTVHLEVTKSLKGDLSSGSILRYNGEPSKVDMEKNISSSVSKR